MKWKAKSRICFWLSYHCWGIVFLSSTSTIKATIYDRTIVYTFLAWKLPKRDRWSSSTASAMRTLYLLEFVKVGVALWYDVAKVCAALSYSVTKDRVALSRDVAQDCVALSYDVAQDCAALSYYAWWHVHLFVFRPAVVRHGGVHVQSHQRNGRDILESQTHRFQ